MRRARPPACPTALALLLVAACFWSPGGALAQNGCKNGDTVRVTADQMHQPGQTRMRQIFMTGFSACIGLVPAAISTADTIETGRVTP
jgi:hypothetical protein